MLKACQHLLISNRAATIMKRMVVESINKLLLSISVSSRRLAFLKPAIKKKFERDLTYRMLYRLPSSDAKTMLKLPCPWRDSDNSIEIDHIDVFKRLRFNFTISQEDTCAKCPRKTKCKLAGIPYSQIIDTDNTSPTAIYDLTYFFLALQRQPQGAVSQLKWLAAYKTLQSLIVMLKDRDQLKKQSYIYYAAEKLLIERENKLTNKKKKQQIARLEERERKFRERMIHLPDK